MHTFIFILRYLIYVNDSRKNPLPFCFWDTQGLAQNHYEQGPAYVMGAKDQTQVSGLPVCKEQ